MSKNIRGNTTANLTVNNISLLNAGFTSFTAGTGTLGDLTVTNTLSVTGAFNPTNITTGALVSDTLRVIVLPNTTTDTTSRKLLFVGANDEIFTGTIDYQPSTDTLACANFTSSGTITSNGSTVLALTEPTNTTTSHTILLRDESNNRVYKTTDFKYSPVEDMMYVPNINISSINYTSSSDIGYIVVEVGGDLKKVQGIYNDSTGYFTLPKLYVSGEMDLRATASTVDADEDITFHNATNRVSYDAVNAFSYNPSTATLKSNNIISSVFIDSPLIKQNGVDIASEFLSITTTTNQSIASNITLTNVEATSINATQIKQGFTPISTTFLAKIGSANQTIASSLITMNDLACDDVTCGDITSDNIITTGLESDALTLNVSAISDLTQVVTLLTCANNSTANSNKIERTSNSDITFEPGTGLLKIPKLMIKYFSTTQTNDYLPILQRQSSLVVSIDQPSGVLDFGYSPGLNTLRVLNIGRDGKSFELPNNTNDSNATGYALTISDVTTTPPKTTWAVVPSSSSFVDLSSTQSISGTKSFNTSPVFNNISGSTANNEFTILTQNQGTFQAKKFVGDLSYNPFKQQLKCPRYFNQTLQLNYTTTYYCESYTVWDSSNTFGHDTYIKLSHNSGTGGNPTVTQHLQNIQNTATTPTTSAISFAQTASPTYWGISGSAYEGVWYVSLACIYQNRLSGGSDRVVPRLDIRKYDGTSTWEVQSQISVGTQYMRQDQGSLSTLRCQGPVYLNNNNLLRVFCNLEKGSIANPPTFNDSTNSWSGIDITISMRYLGTSSATESETVTTL